VPLLDYGLEAAEARGARPMPLTWPQDPLPVGPSTQQWVCEEVRSRLDAVLLETDSSDVVVIAKSLGTLAMPVLAELGTPAVLFTPLLVPVGPLDVTPVLGAVATATAPVLLVGGGADRTWDGGAASRTGADLVEVPDADHGLRVPGPGAASAAVLGAVITRVEHFLDSRVWPIGEGD
jgi:hypothetical protein